MTTLNGPLGSAVTLVPKFDTTVACQSSYTKVFASDGSFQDVCGELIGVVLDRPVQSPPFISNLLLENVSDFHDYSRNANRGEKVKINKNPSAADDRRLAADKKRGQSASSLRRHLQCIVGEITIFFPRSKSKTKRLAS